MSDDPWKSEEAQAWVKHIVDDVLPNMEDSSFVISITPSDEGDVKYWVELGASIMMNKPILVVAVDNRDVPDKLRLVADEIVILPGKLSKDEPSLNAAIERMKAKIDAEDNS